MKDSEKYTWLYHLLKMEQLPCAAKVVAAMMAHSTNEAGECPGSISDLAHRCGISSSGFRASVKALEAAGLVRISGLGGGNDSNVYVIIQQGACHNSTGCLSEYDKRVVEIKHGNESLESISRPILSFQPIIPNNNIYKKEESNTKDNRVYKEPVLEDLSMPTEKAVAVDPVDQWRMERCEAWARTIAAVCPILGKSNWQQIKGMVEQYGMAWTVETLKSIRGQYQWDNQLATLLADAWRLKCESELAHQNFLRYEKPKLAAIEQAKTKIEAVGGWQIARDRLGMDPTTVPDSATFFQALSVHIGIARIINEWT